VSRAVASALLKRRSDTLVLAFDLAATLLFAVEGGLAAVDARLDLFGVLVVGFATAVGGGMLRDVLLSDLPPAALRDGRYVATAVTGGAAAFMLSELVRDIPDGVLTTLDAAALGRFAVSGAAKALNFGTSAPTATLLGALTGVGGGVVRDVLLNETPRVLVGEIYAVAALLGAAVMVAGERAGLPRWAAMAAGGTACFVLRSVSDWQDWDLPRAAVQVFSV
jgi:uncharacterized membrane protein YeiH